jgi:thioesterase domain-containing protein
MKEIEGRCGHDIPLATLFDADTPRLLAQALRADDDVTRKPWYLVNANGAQTSSSPILFCWHGDFALRGFWAKKLGHYLGADQPICALPPRGLDEASGLETIEEMARAQMETVLTLQPRGPYFLLGYCNGGIVAFEVARQLRSRGHKVAMVTLIASDLHGQNNSARRRMSRALVRRRVDRSYHGRRRGQWRMAKRRWKRFQRQSRSDKLRTVWRVVSRQLRRWWAEPASSTASAEGQFEEDREVQARLHACIWLLKLYRPGYFDGQVTLIWPEETQTWRRDPSQCWRPHARAVDVRTMAGSHDTCLTTHIDELAQHIRASLAAVRRSDN